MAKDKQSLCEGKLGPVTYMSYIGNFACFE